MAGIIIRMKRAIDMMGKRFQALEVVEPAGVNSNGEALWRCVCDCGKQRIATGVGLRKGLLRSCGCENKPRPIVHGLFRTPEYRTLMGMIARCTNEKNQRYPEYGGRGITVCERWMNSMAAFYADMGRRPSALHSIERINNDGNYEPGNCRWATQKEQCRNRRTTVLHAAHGKSLTLPEWSEVLGVKEITLRKRLRAGWPSERVFTASDFRFVPKAQQFQRAPGSPR